MVLWSLKLPYFQVKGETFKILTTTVQPSFLMVTDCKFMGKDQEVVRIDFMCQLGWVTVPRFGQTLFWMFL